MRIRSFGIVAAAVLCSSVVFAAPASAMSAPAQPSFTITGMTDRSVTVEWVDHSTNEAGFKWQLRREDTDWTDALELRDHRAGQPAATGWTYSHKFTVALDPRVRGVCLRVRSFNDDDSSDWTAHKCTMPDLVVNGMTAPTFISENLPFSVGYTTCNLGIVTAERSTVQLRLTTRAPVNQSVPGLAPGECFSSSFSVVFGLPKGSYTASIHVDVGGVVTEAMEINNTGARAISVI